MPEAGKPWTLFSNLVGEESIFMPRNSLVIKQNQRLTLLFYHQGSNIDLTPFPLSHLMIEPNVWCQRAHGPRDPLTPLFGMLAGN
jgi:hypothetical protein